MTTRRPAAATVAAVVASALALGGCAPDGRGSGGAPDGEPAPSGAHSSTTAAPTPDATAPSAAGSPTAPAQPDPSPSPPVRLAPFDAEAATRFAVDLAGLGPRHAGTDGDARARRVIAAAILGSGWQLVREQVALPQGGTTENLLAVRDPAHLERPHVVLGGHHDTIGDSPGANDNASGIGVLVALLRELDDEADALPVPLVVVAFGAEEFQPATPRVHHLGSEQYAVSRSSHVLAALVVDMVGNGPDTCVCWFEAGPRLLADRLLAVAAGAGLAGHRVEARGDISDHGPFARRGVPAAFLWSGPDGRLHTPADTAEHLRVADVRRAGDLALAFVRSLAPSDATGLRPTP